MECSIEGDGCFSCFIINTKDTQPFGWVSLRVSINHLTLPSNEDAGYRRQPLSECLEAPTEAGAET